METSIDNSVPFFCIKIVGTIEKDDLIISTERVIGCNSYDVTDPNGNTVITAHTVDFDDIKLSIPKDGTVIYITNGDTGHTIDKYPSKQGR